MAGKRYFADFETTSAKQKAIDGYTRVWLYIVIDIDTEEVVSFGTDIKDFMNWLSKKDGNHRHKNVYFHNLQFDGTFILDYAMKMGMKYLNEQKLEPNTFNCLISNNIWYSIEMQFYKTDNYCTKAKIYDSYKILPFKEEYIAKSFNLGVSKGSIDYELYRPLNYKITNEEKEYVETDAIIGARAMRIMLDIGLTKMTIGSNALADFKERISKQEFNKLFPQLSVIQDKDIRKSYYGGWVYANKNHQGQDYDDVISLDENSMYPDKMRNRLLPYGIPFYFKGKYKKDDEMPLYIQHIMVDMKLKEDHLPTISKRHFRYLQGDMFIEDTNGELLELYLTNLDLELMLKHYNIFSIQYLDGYKFQGKYGIFDEYIDYWYDIKQNNTGTMREVAKLMLNNLYGKFATNPIKQRDIPFIDEDGILAFEHYEEISDKTSYIPMGVYITAWARYDIINVSQKFFKHHLYSDTDSIKLFGITEEELSKHLELHETKLGAWKVDGRYKKFSALRSKTYKYIDYDDELHIVCSGLPKTKEVRDRIKYEDFVIGFELDNAKLQRKRVIGGVVLAPTSFKLRKGILNNGK